MRSDKPFRINVTFSGELARAFIDEFVSAVKAEPTTSKAEVVRALLVEALHARGHTDIEDTVEWGGYRERGDDEQGQPMGAAA